MSRDYAPESVDPRDAGPEPVSRGRQTGRSASLEQGPGSDAQDDARLTPEPPPKTETERPSSRARRTNFAAECPRPNF